MEGLAKIAYDYDKMYGDDPNFDYEKLYEVNPDLDQLRLNELAAYEQYEKDHAAYQDERKGAISKGMMQGLGIGGGLGILPGAITRNPGLAAVGALGGGMLGGLTGGSIADSRLQKTSPLYQRQQRSLDKAIRKQDAHINRWMELAYPDEF